MLDLKIVDGRVIGGTGAACSPGRALTPA